MSPLRRLAAIVGIPLRVHAVEERITRLGDAGFVDALDTLARAAATGASTADADAMLACALYFCRHAGEDRVGALAAAARGRPGATVALALLDAASPHKALSPRGRLRDQGGPRRVIREATLRSPSSDEVRAMVEATTRDTPWSDVYARFLPDHDYEASWERVRLPPAYVAMQVRGLARHNDPGVVGTLLGDPAMSLRQVLRIASRRPTSPEIVATILARDGWITRAEVRAALVENPFTPTRVVLLLLPTCRGSLRALANANVHPRVRELVALLSAAA